MFDFDLDSIPSGPFETPLWWVLIGVVIALLFTLQALETAVEGAWPHQRRDNEYVPGTKGVKPAWALAATLLVLIGIVVVMIWQDLAAPDGANLGGWLLGLGWLLFLVFGLNLFGLGRLLGTLGMLGPLAIGFVLLIADALLLVTLLDVLPEWSTVWDGIKDLIETLLPFVEFGDDAR